MILPQHETVRSSGVFSEEMECCRGSKVAQVEQDSIMATLGGMYGPVETLRWWQVVKWKIMRVVGDVEGRMTNHVMT